MKDEKKKKEQLVNDLAEMRKRIAELEASEAEREHAEQERVRLERLHALGEMSAGVSNSLNNILTGILGPAELLKERIKDPESLREVEVIFASAIRARELVRRLSQTVQGEEGDALHPVPVHVVVQESLRTARSRWKDEVEARGISIEVVTELEDAPPIGGTQAGLHDILTNLLFNAVDALPEGGTITVGAKAVEEGVQLTVRDTGLGMDEETRRRAFEPFFTTKAEVEIDTGLGLSTVHGIVTRWGGTVDVESAPGKGTTFAIRFPAWTEPELEQEKGVEVHAVRRAKVLTVDDEQVVRDLMSYLLSEDHEVETVMDGQEALEGFAPGQYDVALIDLEMPGMPGDQVAQKMRQVDPSLATVLITGYVLEENDLRLSAFDFLIQKPFVPLNKIRNVVTQAVELHDTRAKGSG